MARRTRNRSRKPLTRQEREALDRLLFTFEFGIDRKMHSLMEWATLLHHGAVDDDTRLALEAIGIRLDRNGQRDITLRLANPYLRERERALALDYFGVRSHFNTLLRRIGGWSGGTYRFAGKPQRATCLALRQAKPQNRYNPQISDRPSPPIPHVSLSWPWIVTVPASA